MGEFDLEEQERKKNRNLRSRSMRIHGSPRSAPAMCKESSVQELRGSSEAPCPSCVRESQADEINRGKLKDFFAAKILKGYAKSSVIHMKAVISNILNNAVDNEIIPTNVSLGIKIPQKKKNGDEEEGNEMIDTLTPEETNLVLETVNEHFPKEYPLCLLLLRTGMRIGEALALRWGDIDFNGRFIHVQRGLSRMKIQTPKSGKSRRVDMSQQLAETLDGLQGGIQEERPRPGTWGCTGVHFHKRKGRIHHIEQLAQKGVLEGS